MSYRVLARKWRPQSFDSLIGQEPIVTALSNALTEGKIAQAYLFSGIRGVGKTTAARLLAKALNCEQGPTATPCNQCRPCVDITRGSDLDVLEIDAATHSKVEQVRELTESLRYGPARDRYKVVVIDEIHRLSRAAFDALLKIVEEPPDHLVFIFATTEIEAVPVTILSRCQEFHFRRVPSDVVAAHLAKIAADEGITASEASMRLVARAGEGSVRDAVALFDQLATFGSGTVSDEEAVRLLGGLDVELFRTLLQAIAHGDGSAVWQAVRRIEDEGWDPKNVFSQFLAYCRDALHLSMGGDPARIDLPEEEAKALAVLAREAGYENLLRLNTHLLTSEQVVRRSESGVLAVEIAWLKAAELPKLVKVEELLKSHPAPLYERGEKGNPEKGTPPPRAAAARPAPAPRPVAAPPPARPEPAPASPPPQSAPAPAARPAPAPGGGTVADFLQAVAVEKPPLVALLSAAQPRFEGDVLVLTPPPGDKLLEQRLSRDSNLAIVQEAARATVGPIESFRIVAPTETEPRQERQREDPGDEPEEVDPYVQGVLQMFNGQEVEDD